MEVTWKIVGGRLVASDKLGKELRAWDDPEGLGVGVAECFNRWPALGLFALGLDRSRDKVA